MTFGRGIPATLRARRTHDGLVEMHDHIPLGQSYTILAPPVMKTWTHLPTRRMVPRVSVQCAGKAGLEEFMPLELLMVEPKHVPVLVSFLLDMIRR